MFCSKCGKEIEKGAKFCAGCGEKVTAKKETIKAEKVEKEVKEVKKVEEPKTTATQESSGLGIAGMIIGIISFLLSWSIVFILLPVVGLILSLCAKGKKGFKITGIILNALSIAISIIILIVCINMGVAGLFSLAEKVENDPTIQETIKETGKEVKKAVKSGYPYGTWTCVPYSSMNLQKYDYENIATGNSKDDLTVLKLNTDRSYQYGPYVDSYKNYYKGTFTYEIETEKNEESNNKANDYKFIMIKGPVNSFMLDGQVQSTTDKSLDMEMELFGQYDYDKALIIFTSSYNMYMCER